MHDLIVQQGPLGSGPEARLFLLFHGVGANAQDLRGLAELVAAQQPHAWVVSVRAAHPSDLGSGWQWFSVQGVTAHNRAGRVAAAMPDFLSAIAQWQDRTGVDADATTLVGFSQGAIMALEASLLAPRVARRVAALAGRFASPPLRAPQRTRIHLLHGQNDGVVPAQESVEAHAQLAALGADVSIDIVPGLGHGIDQRMATRLIEHLMEPASEES